MLGFTGTAFKILEDADMQQAFSSGILTFPLLLFILGMLGPVHAELVYSQSGYELSVKLTPRLGAFNRILFEESLDATCQDRTSKPSTFQTWQTYRKSLHDNSSFLAQQLLTPVARGQARVAHPAPQWDIITTQTPFLSDLPMGCGYGARRVFASVSLPPGSSASCEFRLGGVPQRDPKMKPGPCSLYVTLSSNLETPLEVVVTEGAASPGTTIHGVVPEDFLIVSMGDSYASGEGNPDIPKSDKYPAQWMDPWCHRSAFAGPIQAGLLLMENPEKIANPRYHASIKAGAVTIVSFACSGGLVAQGLNGSFEGTVKWLKFLEIYSPSRFEGEKDAIGSDRKTIGPQLTQLQDFLSSQERGNAIKPKTSIDLLLLSGGGNDVLFGPLVTKLLSADVSSGDRQKSLANQMKPNSQELQKSYSTFLNALESTKISHQKRQYRMDSLGVAVTLYPDPSFEASDRYCRGSIEQNSPGVIALIASFFSSFTPALAIEEAESSFVSTQVVKPLNEIVSRVSDRWLPIDVSKTPDDDVVNHGWCNKGEPGYVPGQKRWFRTLLDSEGTQGGIHGTFHPTWELNRKLTGVKIASVFRDAVNAEPAWHTIRIEPSKIVSGLEYAPAFAKFTYLAPDTAGPLPNVYIEETGVTLCHQTSNSCLGKSLGTHGSVVQIVADAKHEIYKRKYQKTELRSVKIDTQAPDIACKVSNSGNWSDCNSNWVNARGVKVVATDPHAGMQSLQVKLTGENLPERTLTAEKIPDDFLQEVAIELPEDGSFRLVACAQDAVGNSGCSNSFVINVDTTPPEIRRMDVYDTDWANNSLPVIPIFGNASPSPVLIMHDDRSGLAPHGDCVGSTGFSKCQVSMKATGNKQIIWETRDFKNSYKDVAGNTTEFSYSTILVPGFQHKKTIETTAFWQAQLLGQNEEAIAGLKAALAIEPALRSLNRFEDGSAKPAAGSMLNVQPVSDVDLQAKFLFPDVVAAWLNMLTGRNSAKMDVSSDLLENCTRADLPGDVDARSAIAVLRLVSRCAAKHANNKEALATLTSTLEDSNLLGNQTILNASRSSPSAHRNAKPGAVQQ